MNMLFSRLTGVISGVVFTIVFMTLSLMGNNGLKAEKIGDDIYVLIAILAVAIVGVVFFALNKVLAGSICGAFLMAGLLYLFDHAKKEISIELKDLTAGAVFLFVLSVVMMLSYFVGLLFESMLKQRESSEKYFNGK